MLVVQPAGTGGSIVTVPVNADSGGGTGGDPLPLDQTLAVQGQDTFRNELAAPLRLGVEDVAFVDAARLGEHAGADRHAAGRPADRRDRRQRRRRGGGRGGARWMPPRRPPC